MVKRYLVISDMHCDRQHPKAFEFLRLAAKEFDVQEVYSVGDELDLAGMGRWDKDPDAPSAGDELRSSIEALRELMDMFPKMKIATSNHTIRPFKRAFESNIPKQLLKSYHEFLDAPKGWVWADRWIINGNTVLEHGESFGGRNGPIKAIESYRMNYIAGHNHSVAGVTYLDNGLQQNWALATGCLIDPDHPAFSYGKHHKDKPVLGCGVVIENVPQFVPLR